MVSLVTVFFDLAVAVIVGVIVSSLVFAWKKSIELKANKSFNKNGVRVYSVEGHLFFGGYKLLLNLYSSLFKIRFDRLSIKYSLIPSASTLI